MRLVDLLLHCIVQPPFETSALPQQYYHGTPAAASLLPEYWRRLLSVMVIEYIVKMSIRLADECIKSINLLPPRRQQQ